MEDDGDKRELTPAQEHLFASAAVASVVNLPFVFVWAAVLWNQVSSIPVIIAVAATYALLFAIVHLWRGKPTGPRR